VNRKVLLCDCEGSQKVGAEQISLATGLKCSAVHTALCTRQTQTAAKALAKGDVVIACGQEAEHFAALADELGAPAPVCVDIRDRAGWTSDAVPGPKQAALVAEALLDRPETRTVDVVSEGLCLILGTGEPALEAAEVLAAHLSVTVLLDDPVADMPAGRGFDVVAGRIAAATGAFGGFAFLIDAFRQIKPGGRGGFALTEPKDGARTECDVVLDLSGRDPLFPAPEKREGYLRADPRDPRAVAAAIMAASHMSGTFEKPLYVRLEPAICAHSRAGKTGCSNCLDLCPTGAITPDGDAVAVDPMICAGCGACSVACPSGAISYDAPPLPNLLKRIETMASAFRKAGGSAPRLLVHDGDFGAEMISLHARFGTGLPADLIPLSLPVVSGFGHAEALAALGAGFVAVDILAGPRSETAALHAEAGLATALAGRRQVRVLDLSDPDQLADAFAPPADTAPADPVLPLGSRRDVARTAARALNPGTAEPLPLPDGAPYGAVLVDTDACTLCLSCASLCPAGALGDNPDQPELRFQESACLQCGLCVDVCPEDAITLVPQMDLSDQALAERVLHEEEPFECVECGKPFGVRSTVERIAAQLEGKHGMFNTPERARMIRMCDDCRVNAQYHSADNPFAGGERPRPRTTEDYYSKRRDH